MKTVDKIKVMLYALTLQFFEIIDSIKTFCYAEKTKLTEEFTKEHNNEI